MSLINEDLLDKIPYPQLDAFRYFPDIIPYLHNSINFKNHWQSLAQAKYIYSNGVEVRPAGWFRYAFEAIKGFFGFTNHCHPKKVAIGLMKFAYYGYVHGLNKALQNPVHYPMPVQYVQTVVKQRTSRLSEHLQKQLMTYYLQNTDFFKANHLTFQIDKQYTFGESLVRINAHQYIPSIDPINTALIESTIEKLENKGVDYSFISGSDYAKKAAVFNIEQSEKSKGLFNSLFSWLNITENNVYKHLKRALLLDPDCRIENLIAYIDFYCEHRELELAFNLIQKLEDIDQAVAYLAKTPFRKEFLQTHVDKDSRIGIALARHYLNRRYSEYNIHLASQFASDIHSIHPPHVFRYFVSQKEFKQAYDILVNQKHGELSFDANAKKALANHLDKQGENSYDEGNKLRKKQLWQDATRLYGQSLILKRKAMIVEPTIRRTEEYRVHLRLYAQRLIETNQHRDIQSYKAEEVAKAIKFLFECKANVKEGNYKESNYIISALVKGLMLSTDNLCACFQVDLLYDRDYETRIKHDALYRKKIDTACHNLSEIIILLQGTKAPDLIKILAKAYFVLGDMITFFNLTEKSHNPIECHRLASELVPDNPFYLLRYVELIQNSPDHEQLSKKAVKKLKEAGYSVIQYKNWYDERWHKEKIGFHGIVNVHTAEAPKETNWLATSTPNLKAVFFNK